MAESQVQNDEVCVNLTNFNATSPNEDLDQNQMKSMYEDLTPLFQEKEMDDETSLARSKLIPKKRTLQNDNNESWNEVTNRKKRMRESRNSTEICITSKEKFPKQFSLAKLFQSQNITNISKVKFINPFKIIVELNHENSEKLITCDHFSQLGWRFQQPYEVALSYGVIRDIELNLSEDELLKSISCPSEICSVRRLKRKVAGESGEAAWTESESIRVGFKGPTLPKHLCIYDMRVKVEPYVFPVTQCTRCWRYGHVLRMCPSKKAYCPKCAGKHETCETTTYKCINCTGNHMAFNKNCSMYKKEKNIRDIMSELNCSYRKALAIYVPVPSPNVTENIAVEESPTRNQNKTSEQRQQAPPANSTAAEDVTRNLYTFSQQQPSVPTYAQKASTSKSTPTNHIQDVFPSTEENLFREPKTKKKQRKKTGKLNVQDDEVLESQSEPEVTNAPHMQDQAEAEQTQDRSHRSELSFKGFLLKLKNMLFQSEIPFICKIKRAVQICIEYAISWVFQNMPDWSFLLKIVNNYG